MTEHEQRRLVRHRLAVLRHAEEMTGNVSATCRYYGISRQCFYEWRNRFDEFGEEVLQDRSSRPHHSTGHCPFGPSPNAKKPLRNEGFPRVFFVAGAGFEPKAPSTRCDPTV
jgi:transposase-like protein